MLSVRDQAKRRELQRLPFTFVNVAMSADGKLAPASGEYVPFGSTADKELLLEIRTKADAVMCGARTVEAFPMNLGPGGKRFRDQRLRSGRESYNLRIIVSGSGSVDLNSEIFKHRFSPILILTTESAGSARLREMERAGAELHISAGHKIDFQSAFQWLFDAWKVRTLLCEGGGALNGSLFDQQLVDEVYLTICPLLIGGRSSPTMADGDGALNLASAVPMVLKSRELRNGEIFLRYLVDHRF
jgi:riboflavin-specific deaminase-like protein